MHAPQSLNISPELSAFVLGKVDGVGDVEVYLRKLVERESLEKQTAREQLLHHLEQALAVGEGACITVTADDVIARNRQRKKA